MSEFTPKEWGKIRETLADDPTKYGLPKREYGSVVLGSFNIRKLGAVTKRSRQTWDFLAHVCKHFDLLALQEIMDDLSGFQELKGRMGSEFGTIVSDRTGVFSNQPGLGERLGFIYNLSMVKRGEVVSDISFDRTKVLETLARNYDQINQAILPYVDYLKELDQWNSNQLGQRPKKPNVKMPVFITFARQPFCVSFRIVGHPGTNPYEFMAVNAHLYFGDYISDRRQEFDALMAWILGRFIQHDRAYYPNFILLGDLNLDFDNPTTDRDRIEKHIKMFNAKVRGEENVNFPFLDPHPKTKQVLRTNARLTETFDQIGLFNWDQRLPTYKENSSMGENPRGPDYGVFNFVELFSDALYNRGVSELSLSEKKAFFRRFEHEVSDHLPLWLRLPLPD